MNAKERFYSGLAKETIGKITSNTDNWTSFLRTMSRNYEFTYPEQVMIYAQRPNATFCKPYEDWNAENYRRYVKRGSTGIALFVMNRDKPYLRYVFDVADTGVRRSSPELKPWEVTPENRSYVMEAMERTFGVAADGVLEAQLEDIASALAAEYWDDYKKQFLDIVANSFLEEYDELNIEVAFKNAVANSVSYTMYCRFVESPDNYFEHEDFQKVFDFNTRQTVNALGTAVNAISTRMFQEIEKAIGEHEQIKATERSTDYERDDLQTGRRLSDSEPSVGERGRETSGQVRQDASSIFGTEQSDAPERHDSDGEPVPAPVGDRGNSESQSGVSDGAVPEGQPRTGQGNAADGVGAAHEQPESTGGGSRDDGAYQQLSLNLFLSENEQISFIDRAESFTPSAFSFAQEEIDHFLLLGSNTDEARKVVALEYMKQNGQAFADDSSYYLLCSLENVDEDGNLKSKADMFTKRTIKPERRVTSVDTPSEALAISIGERGKVDLPFMAQLLGTPGEYDAIQAELRGVIFKDPMAPDAVEVGWQTADDYLSGDVRSKLRVAQMAADRDSSFHINVEALQKAQPKDLDASEIDVRLGATWIDADYIQQFMEEIFETPYYLRRSIEVKFSELTAEWRINGKSSPNYNDVAAYVTYGTERANAYRILEETLNLKDIRIYDTIEDADGKQKRVLNKKETTLAQQKQQAIKDAFRDWIWRDPHRRETLSTKYNELFNSTRPREYDGSHIRFGGMNPDITLREHQRNAIAHVLYGGNTLLAHEVGAGKTFEMAASAMESKRLGLSQKSLFVVPNHLTLQWANEFLHLYPSAKLLVATKKDFETANRKKFCARIATGDYDAVIIGHSQFEKIPLSAERQERQLREQIDEIEGAIAELKWQRGENFTIKQMEKTRKSLEARLDKLLAADKKDDVITFEQLGVDRLFVDESHAFKNLFLYTKMRNVAGLSTSEAQKSSDMFMKCRYMDELTGGRGVIFATGTPVSNSMTELYTVMRYLQYNTLQQKNLTHFDSWASTFGETTTAIELAPEGTGYRARTRFAKFFNLPELMNMFKEVADIKTSDQLHLPVPEAKFETVVVQPSEYQKDMVASLSERAADVHAGIVDPSVDNMLKITSDGRKLGLDQRLMNTLLPDDPDSKLNACVGNILRIWQDGQADKLTQLVFCDLSTPKNDGTFNVYDDVKTKLIANGVPAEEVAFIHDADTEAKKKDLFAKVRTGQVRVLLGSTQKMGAGTNVQDKLVAVHHLDVGWRPSDMTQRNGRIIRQGNRNKEVQVYQYVTEGTFDAYLYQTLENKQKFISQIMTSKSPVRSCDDVDEQALSYAEIKALCAGNPLIKEKMDLDIDVARLKVLKADHQSQQYRMEDKLLKYFPAEIEKQTGYIHGFEADIKTVEAHPQIADGFCGMEIMGKAYTEKADAGEILLAACKDTKSADPVPLGSYRGFQMELSFDSFRNEFDVTLKGAVSHRVALGTDARGNITRLDNALAGILERLERANEQLNNLYNQQEAAKAEVGKPFPQEAELTAKSQRLAELDAALNMEDSVENRDERSESERPSALL